MRTLKIGDSIQVQASEILGTPAVAAGIVEILYPPGHHYYKDGLYLVVCADDPVGQQPGTTVDSQGRVFCGPPLHGYLVMFP